MKVLALIFVSIFCGTIAVPVVPKSCDDVKNVMICYYASWGIYRPALGQIDVDNIDPNMCTHLVYTFAGLDVIQNAIVSLDPWMDFAANGGKDSYKRFVQLKEKNPCLKTLLALGGWNEKSLKYSVMASTPESRNAFADKVLRYISQYEFDGFDFDWEYPANRGGIAVDKTNFIELLKELKKRFQPWNYMLTVAVAATIDVADRAYDIKAISDTVDFVNIMAYDFTASTSETTGLLAPLKPKDGNDKTFTIDASIKYWIDQGCDPKKIVLGIPIYARSFKLLDKDNIGIGAPTVPNKLAGKYTREVGFLSTYELLEILLTNKDYKVTEDSNYANNYATNGTYWFTFDNENSIRQKVKYVKDNGLAGVMAWSLDTDDFQGVFSDDPYPLLTAMNKALFG